MKGHRKRIFWHYKSIVMSKRLWPCNINMRLLTTRGPGLMRVNSSTNLNLPVNISLLSDSELCRLESELLDLTLEVTASLQGKVVNHNHDARFQDEVLPAAEAAAS